MTEVKVKKCCKDIDMFFFEKMHIPKANNPKEIEVCIMADFGYDGGWYEFKYCPFCGKKIEFIKGE